MRRVARDGRRLGRLSAEVVQTGSRTETVQQSVPTFNLLSASVDSELNNYLGQEGTVTTVTQCVFTAGDPRVIAVAVKNGVSLALRQMFNIVVSNLEAGQKINLTLSERNSVINKALANARAQLEAIPDARIQVNGRTVKQPSVCS